MKKVSILTLSLVFAISNISVEASPRKIRTNRRQVNNITTVDTTQTTDTSVESSVMPVETIDLSVITETQKNTVNNETLNILNEKITNVKNSCSGIKSSLDTIFGLSVATTVSSGLGTAAAAGALATGIAKSKTDEKIEEKEKEIENLSHLVDALNENSSINEIKEVYDLLEEQVVEEIKELKAEISEDTKKSKTLGNVRTGLMAGATATSAVSMGTSLGATLTAKKLAEKMEACNKAVADLKTAISVAEAEEVEVDKLAKAREITSVCTGFDKDNIKTLKTTMTASAVVSGIGTATASAGTVTSILANSNKVRGDNSDRGKKKEKNLNLVSNIMAGVTAGTSGASTVLSATAIKKAKQDSEMAERCEAALAQ